MNGRLPEPTFAALTTPFGLEVPLAPVGLVALPLGVFDAPDGLLPVPGLEVVLPEGLDPVPVVPLWCVEPDGECVLPCVAVGVPVWTVPVGTADVPLVGVFDAPAGVAPPELRRSAWADAECPKKSELFWVSSASVPRSRIAGGS